MIEPGAVFDAPDAAFAALSSTDASLQGGIEPQSAILVDPRPIFATVEQTELNAKLGVPTRVPGATGAGA